MLQPGDWDYVLAGILGTSLIRYGENPENLKCSSSSAAMCGSEPVASDIEVVSFRSQRREWKGYKNRGKGLGIRDSDPYDLVLSSFFLLFFLRDGGRKWFHDGRRQHPATA